MEWDSFLLFCQAIAITSHCCVIVDYLGSFSFKKDRSICETEKIVLGFLIATAISFVISVSMDTYHFYLEIGILAYVLSLTINKHRYSLNLFSNDVIKPLRLINSLFILEVCIITYLKV